MAASGTKAARAGIVFDIDGTLLYLTDSERDAYVGAFREALGIEGVNSDWGSYQSQSDVGVAREVLELHLGRPHTQADLDSVLERYVGLMSATVSGAGYVPREVPGASAALAALAERRDLRIGLATANLRPVAELRLRRAGMWDRFEAGGYGEDGDTKDLILGASIRRLAQAEAGIDRPLVFIGDRDTDA